METHLVDIVIFLDGIFSQAIFYAKCSETGSDEHSINA